jgi:predicted HAD superfamily phosphohydrolase YqeG
VIGDQLFTDVLGGNLLGMTTVLVAPLSSSDLPHTLVLRQLEALVLRGREPVA